MSTRTEDQLRELFHAPLDPGAQQRLSRLIDDLSGDGSTSVPSEGRHRSGRWLAAASAGIAIAGIVTVLVVVLSGRSTRQQTTWPAGSVGPTTQHPCAAGSATRFATLSMSRVSGVEAQQKTDVVTSCSGYADLTLYVPPQGGQLGNVTIFAPGVFDKATITGIAPVSSGGVTGYPLLVPSDPAEDGAINADGSPVACINPARPKVILSTCSMKVQLLGTDAAMAWQYAPNSWGLVRIYDKQSGTQWQSEQLRIAAAVHPSTDAPSLPMKLTYLPSDSYPVLLTHVAGTALVGQEYGRVDLGIVGQDPGCPYLACGDQVQIEVTNNSTHSVVNVPGQHLTINGHAALIFTPTAKDPAPRVVMATGRWYVDMTATQTSGISANELVKIARGMRFADQPHNTSTWFSPAQAFPQ